MALNKLLRVPEFICTLRLKFFLLNTVQRKLAVQQIKPFLLYFIVVLIKRQARKKNELKSCARITSELYTYDTKMHLFGPIVDQL